MVVMHFDSWLRYERVPGFSRSRYVFFACIAFFLAMTACSGNGGSSGGDSYGSISFSLVAPSDDADQVQYKSVDFPCQEYDIASVEAEILDTGGSVVATGGPWDCSGGRGTIGYIKAGDDYTLWVYLRNSDGNVRYQGSVSGLRVRMGRITNAEVALERINLTPIFEEIESQQTQAGQTLSFTISASDPDGDPIIYTALSLPSGASFDPDTALFSWTPGDDQVGTFTARFQASDNAQGDDAEVLEVYIIVTGPNQSPVFTAVKSKYVREGQTLKFTIKAADPDGDTVTYSALSLPAGATFNAETRLFTWRPGYSQSGTYTAQFAATDDSIPPQTATLDVTIIVSNTNRSPVLTVPTGVQTVTPTGTLVFQISATDPDGNGITYAAADLPRNSSGTYFSGVSFDAATGTFRWSAPGTSAVGEYTVLFIATDNGSPAKSDYGTVTIQVSNSDNPIDHRRHPVLTPIGPKSIDLGDTLEFSVSAYDPDYADGGSSALVFGIEEISGQQFPDGASFDPETGIFSWVPEAEGNYWVRFVVTDPNDIPLPLSDWEDVVISVGDVNHPPVLDPIGDRVVWDGETLEFTVFATDPDGDGLTFSASSLPSGAAFDAYTHTFTWTPNFYTRCIPPKTYTVRFTVTDNGTPVESDYEDIVITVLFE